MLHRLRKFLPRGKRSLQTRFQIGLAIILFTFCLFSVVAVSSLQRSILEREALRQTDLVMNSIQATRQYVREVLRPKMYDILPDNSFVIESMSSSYITRVIIQTLQEDAPEFGYRRVALNPRNQDFSPNEFEQEMITYFRENEQETTWSGVIRSGGSQHFIRFDPVRFTQSCLVCHGAPESAPAGIIERYGKTGGFYKTEGEVSGVVSVSIPLDSDLAGIRKSLLWLFTGILGSGFLLFLFIRLFFRQLVIVNLHSLLVFFRETVTDAKGSALYLEMISKDEMSEMSDGMRLLAEHIRETHTQLENYTSTLEEKVALRTEALERSHDQLQRQVRQRNRELHLFTVIAEHVAGPASLKTILTQVLQETLRVIPSEGGAIYLLDTEHFSLFCSENVSNPPATLNIADDNDMQSESGSTGPGCNYIKFLPDSEETAIIPLCCRNRTLGLFLITHLNRNRIEEPLRDLLVSIGNQIGIAIESLQNTLALRRSEQLLKSIFKGISDPLILLDMNGTVKMANKAFLSRHGVTEDQVIGRPIDTFSAASNCFLSKTSARLDLSIPTPRKETIHDDDGNCFEVLFYPVLGSDQNVSAVICLAHDITELMEIEQNMRKTEKLAAVGQLAAGVAHEINNPLSVILCHTDVIKNEFPSFPELQQDIHTIEHHARLCHKIISDLLNFTRHSEIESPRIPTRLHDEIHHVVTMIEPQFSKKQIALSVEQNVPEIRCLLDSGRFRQVIMNLLINAGQAIVAGGNIRIKTQTQRSMAVITIEDDGTGIDPGIIDQIFDPFFTTKQQGEGTGLGLSVSYGIIRDHGGDIQVTSKPGHTVFSISLPKYGENDEL